MLACLALFMFSSSLVSSKTSIFSLRKKDFDLFVRAVCVNMWKSDVPFCNLLKWKCLFFLLGAWESLLEYNSFKLLFWLSYLIYLELTRIYRNAPRFLDERSGKRSPLSRGCYRLIFNDENALKSCRYTHRKRIFSIQKICSVLLKIEHSKTQFSVRYFELFSSVYQSKSKPFPLRNNSNYIRRKFSLIWFKSELNIYIKIWRFIFWL